MLFGDARRRQAWPAAIGAEQQVHLVLVDQLFKKLGRGVWIAAVVVIDDLDLVFLAADRDAAALVDLLYVKIVTVLALFRFGRQAAGQRQGGAEADQFVCKGRTCAENRDRRYGDRHTQVLAEHATLPGIIPVMSLPHRRRPGKVAWPPAAGRCPA